MNNDDLIYASLLLFSITFGYFIRLFKERELRKWVSTLVGLLLVFVVSGFHIVHPLICTLINALIIVNMDKTWWVLPSKSKTPQLPKQRQGTRVRTVIPTFRKWQLLSVLGLWTSSIMPSHMLESSQYAKSDEFYSERSFWYRLWYTYPSFFIFRMRIYSGLIMSECVCTMAGLGAYPVATAPVAGQGPSKDFALLRQVVSDPEQAKKATYNFETIHNIDPYGSEFIPTLRQSMKSWNICIQYWLAVNVYKRLPRNAFRTTVTLFVSAFWHGIYAGYYLCICTVALYLPVEDLYVKHFTKGLGGMAGKIADFVVWFFRLQALSYMAITFFLLTIHDSFKYWNSIYFCCHVLWAAFYMVGVVAVKARKKSNMEKDKSI
ncbi:lysophospholipid acyltransferase 7 isoform X2 [Bacillus rossius redtenbacheri]|uniref:lysophospholipid acyltransferase 7 isoform X2 n=1 Tax=Bacillus rossius redtenbacheri TaxID=93214 RepID=UPI002FDDDCD8